MFGKKISCPRCKSAVKEQFDFCPYCGCDVRNPEKDMRDYGFLGKNEIEGSPLIGGLGGMGFTDKMLNSMLNNLVKALDNQMKNSGTAVENTPMGIQIRFGGNQKPVQKKQPRRNITQAQIDKMAGLPRGEAKTNVRRLSDKVLYELKAPGIETVEDVFVSKLETGYEVKAIAKKKVYINTLPINLPLKGYSIDEDNLTVEFGIK